VPPSPRRTASPQSAAADATPRRARPEQAQVASPLAAIPYDLRHACVSFWLRSGVSLAKTARRAGQSIAVLQRYYAKVLDGEEDRMNTLIELGLAEHETEAKGP
jgi:integrase